jgi:hypothetical protein
MSDELLEEDLNVDIEDEEINVDEVVETVASSEAGDSSKVGRRERVQYVRTC